MKALIVEDEKAAVRNLTALLAGVEPRVEILAVTDSIVETTEWFAVNPMPDVVFMDIHLADGSAFEIFSYVKITCPVIFTTAYDEYALQAFKVNSIDYLLKPIGENDLRQAMDKLEKLYFGRESRQDSDLSKLIHSLHRHEHYKTHFLLPHKSGKLIPLAVDTIQYFYITDGVVKAVVSEKENYLMSQTLDELTECLEPRSFFRANRQYLISKSAIKDIDLWFNSRLSVNLRFTSPEKVLISKARVAEFKDWFMGNI